MCQSDKNPLGNGWGHRMVVADCRIFGRICRKNGMPCGIEAVDIGQARRGHQDNEIFSYISLLSMISKVFFSRSNLSGT